ncbi:MAG: alpha/beta hydrolase [Gammaproteobacteria bacterium]|nr:alpha/beta hydrolase [Gammaproteobacteria bacterium]
MTSSGSTHEVHWTEWGAVDHAHAVICAHGLTRNGRDFDYLAKRLGNHCRLVCPDYPGRGTSPKLVNPQHYSIEQYVIDTFSVIKTLEYDKLDWIGTSMGGLIGMAIASMPEHPVSRMIINDVGAEIPQQSLFSLAAELADQPDHFNSMEDVYDYFRKAYPGFGKLEDHHYRHMGDHSVWPGSDGNGYELARDPAIITELAKVLPSDLNLWEIWEKIKIPALIIRGEHSGLLLAETVDKMLKIHMDASAIQFADCGHAPSLMTDDQIDEIADWLGLS